MGSHVLRTKNIHCALRIGAFPFSERIRRARIVLGVSLSRFTVRMRRVYRALLGSHALRTKNIRRVLRFGAFTFSERRTCIVFSMFVSPAIHGRYEFGRIAYHQYVNIYAVHQLYDSLTIVSRPVRVVRLVRVVPSRLKCHVTNDMHVTTDPQPVQPVNHCFTTCTGCTSRVKSFTGRIRSTVLKEK